MSDTCEVRTHAGYPTGLAGQRLNHSAKVSFSYLFIIIRELKVRTHIKVNYIAYHWKIIEQTRLGAFSKLTKIDSSGC